MKSAIQVVALLLATVIAIELTRWHRHKAAIAAQVIGGLVLSLTT